MFCYQCEQTSKGTGCVQIGVCGKNESTATLQDVLSHAIKGISMYATRARKISAQAIDPAIDAFVTEALFATLTNVNFDPKRLEGIVQKIVVVRENAHKLYERTCAENGHTPETLNGVASWMPTNGVEALAAQGKLVQIPARISDNGADITSLQEIIFYGIKGVSAYAEHARQLGVTDPGIFATIHEVLDFLTHPSPTVENLIATAMRVGELNFRTMEMLDRANTTAYGNPVPTQVRINPRAGKAILISGHDLADLAALLEQTKGLGIQIYTHGEMLPAHGYPKLKAYEHLAGNYGGAWMDQAREFDVFPGAILMTSNCIQEPRPSYKNRIFTCGPVAWPGVEHISNRDFSPVIACAMRAKGFEKDGTNEMITVGFGHNAVLGVAGAVIDAVKSGAVRHFFLIGGCDGARTGRDYYTTFAESVPKDCIVLTLGCGKFRFNKQDFGTIGGLPRLLDLGQCNDAYSALKIAVALAGAFNCEVNDLPLSLIISWYEQKAVSVLLTLLHLGVKNIRIGPTLPAFISPAVLGVLQEKFNLMAISTPEKDLAAILKS